MWGGSGVSWKEKGTHKGKIHQMKAYSDSLSKGFVK